MRGLVPTHITFGATKGALTGENAMHAAVGGETVLFVHSQANRQSHPHLSSVAMAIMCGNVAISPTRRLPE